MNPYLKHVAFGVCAGVGAIVLVWLEARFGLGVAAIVSAACLGLGYEAVQRLRREGVPSWRDALATAAGGGLVAAVLAVLKEQTP